MDGTCERLLGIIDRQCRAGNAPYGQREIDCLIALVEDGTVTCEEQLAEYGFEESLT